MKTKFLPIIICCFAFALSANANDSFLVSDFESGDLYWNPIGAGVTTEVVDNPLASSVINPSEKVLKITCPKDQQYGGAIISVTDLKVGDTEGNLRYAHVKFYKTTAGTSIFKIQGGPVGAREISTTIPTGQWVEMVFDFKFSGNNDAGAIGAYKEVFVIANSSEYEENEVVIYIDDIIFSNDPTKNNGLPASTDEVAVLDNFESGFVNFTPQLNAMDKVTFEVVDNPKKEGINASNKVLKVSRDVDAKHWIGFWASLNAEAAIKCDMDKYNYAHFKILQDISGASASFKVERTAEDAVEKSPMEAPSKVDEWEELIFDLSDATGLYPIVALMPDYVSDRPAHAVYIDDIVFTKAKDYTGINEIPVVASSIYVETRGNTVSVHFNLDMPLATIVTVYDISGKTIASQTTQGVSGENVVDLNVSGTGVYLLKVSANNKGVVTKFAK